MRIHGHNFNLLGKSSKYGNNGINDPGDINPGKSFKNSFSNLQEKTKRYLVNILFLFYYT